MSDLAHKFLKFILAEVVGAIIFSIGLVVLANLPNDEISSQLTKGIITIWIIYGIGTPIAIFTEIEDQILRVFRR
jgi:hypothetical protein|tara:strand:+ start:1854 stop:2078 length:225 start_codon:yes stop_codon:yes gene_type:complete